MEHDYRLVSFPSFNLSKISKNGKRDKRRVDYHYYYCYFHFYFVEELSIHLHVCNDVNVISLSSIIILRLCSDLFQENSNEEGEFQVCFILLFFSKINTQPIFHFFEHRTLHDSLPRRDRTSRNLNRFSTRSPNPPAGGRAWKNRKPSPTILFSSKSISARTRRGE